MRVQLVDPPAYTPPYDHALAAALARAGAAVTLVTAPFAHGGVMAPEGYVRAEAFYAWRRPRGRRAARLIRHVPDMLAYARRAPAEADVVHFQWLALQQLDAALLPRMRPLVLTAHDVLPREPRPGQHAGQRRLYARMDAVIVHSDHGARRLVEQAGVPPERVHVIPHGAFHQLAAVAPGRLPAELDGPRRGPVALCFGLMRPYKGLDVLIEAWRRAELPGDSELWLVGMPRMDLRALRAAAPANVRWVTRFVSDAELAATFRAADLAVLPYREIDQSGVLATALAFATPLLATDVGGFPEVAAAGAAELVPAGAADPLAQRLGELLGDAARRAELATAARRLAAPGGSYGWDSIARRTLDLYASLRHA